MGAALPPSFWPPYVTMLKSAALQTWSGQSLCTSVRCVYTTIHVTILCLHTLLVSYHKVCPLLTICLIFAYNLPTISLNSAFNLPTVCMISICAI